MLIMPFSKSTLNSFQCSSSKQAKEYCFAKDFAHYVKGIWIPSCMMTATSVFKVISTTNTQVMRMKMTTKMVSPISTIPQKNPLRSSLVSIPSTFDA